MIEVRDECVCCPPRMGCLGSLCPYINVERIVCDKCGEDAFYSVDGNDFCERCAEDYIFETFNELSLREQAECLGLDFKKTDT